MTINQNTVTTSKAPAPVKAQDKSRRTKKLGQAVTKLARIRLCSGFPLANSPA